jgi:hypothetical protein
MLVYTIPFKVSASGNESAGFIKFSTNCTCHSANAILQPWISCRPGRNKYAFSFFRFIRFTFFVICNFDFTFFFNSLRNNPWWCFFLTGRCHVFHDEFWIDEIRRDSRAMNQQNGNHRFLQNNVIGCYTYQQGLY